MPKLVLALLILMLTAGLMPITAAVEPEPELIVRPNTVHAGGTVNVSGICDPDSAGYVISRAFKMDDQHEFAGVGAIPFKTDSAGNFSGSTVVPSNLPPAIYYVTARCGGGNIGFAVKLTVTKPASGLGTLIITLGLLLLLAFVGRELYRRYYS